MNVEYEFCKFFFDLSTFSFDASFALGMWYVWIFTHFHPFSHIFCSFPPQPFLSRSIYPHYGDPEKAWVM